MNKKKCSHSRIGMCISTSQPQARLGDASHQPTPCWKSNIAQEMELESEGRQCVATSVARYLRRDGTSKSLLLNATMMIVCRPIIKWVARLSRWRPSPSRMEMAYDISCWGDNASVHVSVRNDDDNEDYQSMLMCWASPLRGVKNDQSRSVVSPAVGIIAIACACVSLPNKITIATEKWSPNTWDKIYNYHLNIYNHFAMDRLRNSCIDTRAKPDQSGFTSRSPGTLIVADCPS